MKIKSEPKVSRQNIEYHNICKVCPVPVKFSNKKQLSKHDKRKHNKCIDQINTENGTIYLSENEISSQHHKTATCEVCDENFECKQDLEDHQKDIHGYITSFKCQECSKLFSKKSAMNLHKKRTHTTNIFRCALYGKKTKLKQSLIKHMNVHSNGRSGSIHPDSSFGHKKSFEEIEQTQNNLQSKENLSIEAPETVKKSKLKESDIKHMNVHSNGRSDLISQDSSFGHKKLSEEIEQTQSNLQLKENISSESPETVKKYIWDLILQNYPYDLNKMKASNPLSLDEVILLKNENNLSESQVLNICKFLREKYGEEAVSPNVPVNVS